MIDLYVAIRTQNSMKPKRKSSNTITCLNQLYMLLQEILHNYKITTFQTERAPQSHAEKLSKCIKTGILFIFIFILILH